MLYQLRSAVEYIQMIISGLREIKKLKDELFDEEGMIK